MGMFEQRLAMLGSWLTAFLAPYQTHPAIADLPDNPTASENCCPGANDWQLTRVRVDQSGFRSPWIEGYCNLQSAQAGETIEIKVSTDPPRRVHTEIFRLGYYGGKGARLMRRYEPIQGELQPTPSPGAKNLHECRWKTSVVLPVPANWPSVVYISRLSTISESESEPYWQSYVIFIIRDDRPSDILFLCSDNTWQTYNRWLITPTETACWRFRKVSCVRCDLT